MIDQLPGAGDRAMSSAGVAAKMALKSRAAASGDLNVEQTAQAGLEQVKQRLRRLRLRQLGRTTSVRFPSDFLLTFLSDLPDFPSIFSRICLIFGMKPDFSRDFLVSVC